MNDLSREYLDHVAQVNQQNESDDVKRWQEGENELQKQIRISSGIIASGGAQMEEEKKAAKDYDGDGKVESGKDEYFGSKDKAIKKAMKKEEVELDEAERSISDRLDRKNKLMKKTTRKAMDFARKEGEASGHARFNMSRLGRERDNLVAKLNKEGRLSNWRNDLSDLIEVAPMTDVEMEKEG